MEEFSIEKRIYYHDTDCGGVVYYANYLKYLEEVRTEYLLGKGIDLQKLSNNGIWFAVAKVEIEYKSPARYQDTLRIVTSVERIKYSAMQFFQKILKNNTTVAEARTITAGEKTLMWANFSTDPPYRPPASPIIFS